MVAKGNGTNLVEFPFHLGATPERIRELLPWIANLDAQEQKECVAEIQGIAGASPSPESKQGLLYTLSRGRFHSDRLYVV